MVRKLVHDPIFLAGKSQKAGKADLTAAQDLMDTLFAHRESCVGMAANMIGVRKRIIAVADGTRYLLMFNPEIVEKAEPYDTEESCLSLLGPARPTRRWERITVRYQTAALEWRQEGYSGFTAQIIQHEIDHCEGILI